MWARTSRRSIRWPRALLRVVFWLKTTWNIVATYGHIPPSRTASWKRNPELLVLARFARWLPIFPLLSTVLAGPRDPAMPAQILPRRRGKNIAQGLRVALWLTNIFASGRRTGGRSPQAALSCLKRPERSVETARAPAFHRGAGRSPRSPVVHAPYRTLGLPEIILVSGSPPRDRDFLLATLPPRSASTRNGASVTGFSRHPSAASAKLMRRGRGFSEDFDVVLVSARPPRARSGMIKARSDARFLEVNGTQMAIFRPDVMGLPRHCAGLPQAVPSGDAARMACARLQIIACHSRMPTHRLRRDA